MGDRHPNVRTVKSLSLSYTHIHTVWAAHCFVVHKKGTNFSPAQHRNPWVSRQRLSGLLYTWYYMHLASILCVTGLHSQAGNIPCIHTEIWFQCVYAGKYPSSFVPRPCRQSPPLILFVLHLLHGGSVHSGLFLSIWRLLVFTHHCYCNERELVEDISMASLW